MPNRAAKGSLADFVMTVMPRLRLEATHAAAELRQLEADVGRSASADGRYWLARTAALERVAEAAATASRTGSVEVLRVPLAELRSVPAPACNPNDHQGKAA